MRYIIRFSAVQDGSFTLHDGTVTEKRKHPNDSIFYVVEGALDGALRANDDEGYLAWSKWRERERYTLNDSPCPFVLSTIINPFLSIFRENCFFSFVLFYEERRQNKKNFLVEGYIWYLTVKLVKSISIVYDLDSWLISTGGWAFATSRGWLASLKVFFSLPRGEPSETINFTLVAEWRSTFATRPV